MPIKVSDLLKMTEKEISDLFPDFNCAECKNPIDEEGYEKGYAINSKPVCSECYFKSFGAFLEKNPIYIPRLHRGQSNHQKAQPL